LRNKLILIVLNSTILILMHFYQLNRKQIKMVMKPMDMTKPFFLLTIKKVLQNKQPHTQIFNWTLLSQLIISLGLSCWTLWLCFIIQKLEWLLMMNCTIVWWSHSLLAVVWLQ
jgi:hypothetical protein